MKAMFELHERRCRMDERRFRMDESGCCLDGSLGTQTDER